MFAYLGILSRHVKILAMCYGDHRKKARGKEKALTAHGEAPPSCAHLRPTRKQATSSVTPQLNPWALVRRAGELPRWTLLQLWASQLSALCSKSLRVLFCLSLGILQARILEWVAFPQGTIFNPGIKPRSPARGKFGVSPMQVWHWSTKWSKAKANTVCPREHTGHSKHTLPITQEKTRQRQGSWLWLRSWTPYCQIQT